MEPLGYFTYAFALELQPPVIPIFSQVLCCLFVDLTAVCMIEGFNNPNWMVQADRVLKEIGKEKAEEYYKV